MASQRASLKAFLKADAVLAELLPGGGFDTDDFDWDEGGADGIPRGSNGVTISPFFYIRWRTSVPKEVVRSSERKLCEIYVYQQAGHERLDQALARIKTLLHRQQIAGDSRGVNMFHWQTDISELPPAQELGGAAGAMTRYYVDYTRR
jgi:hypothetical protein